MEGTGSLQESEWAALLNLIHESRCIPVLGPALAGDLFVARSELAREWASAFNYPYSDNTDFPRVAQFVETRHGRAAIAKQWVESHHSPREPATDHPAYRCLAE